jgi:hypothetical protein
MSFELQQVPDVRGLSVTLAMAQLRAAGFDIGTVRREPCPARDTVTKQYLGQLPKGSTLNLIVSGGPVTLERSTAMSDDVKDPRTDRSTDGPKFPTPPGEPHKGPGGLGTGTKDAPEKEPAAQPGKQTQ